MHLKTQHLGMRQMHLELDTSLGHVVRPCWKRKMLKKVAQYPDLDLGGQKG